MILLAQEQETRAHQAARHRPVEQADQEHGLAEARAGNGGDGEDDHDGREGHDHVGRAHDHGIPETALEPRDRTKRGADEQ
jgi:hypothetical protein